MRHQEDLLLGLDVGTQGVKGFLVNLKGRVLASAHVEHGSIYPKPDWCEQDMTRNWWQNPVQVIRKLLESDGIKADQIKGIGVSGLYPALGPTDGEGNPLRGAIIYSDNRSVAEVKEVNQALGLHLTSEELTPKLIWYLRNEPELASRTRMVFDAQHYLVYKLCGAYLQDTITVGLHGAIYESPTASWREDVCERFGIPLGILPKVQPPAQIAGTIHQSAAEITGLAEGTPVTSGMPDLYASLLSAGIVHTFETAAYYGTAGLVPVAKQDFLEAAWKPYPHPETGKSHQDGYMFDYPAYCLSVGDAARWFRDEFAPMEMLREINEGVNAYSQLDKIAEPVPPGSDGVLFLPYLQGRRSPDFNPWATGVFFGLKKAHHRGYLFRAILESFGYMIRHGFESFYPQNHPIQRLVATGGGARSPLWRQVVSDITGLRQEYVPEADAPLGAAYLAGIALGYFKDFDILQNEWVKVSVTTEPRPEAQEVYDQYYKTYAELHTALEPVVQHHHEIQLLTEGLDV